MKSLCSAAHLRLAMIPSNVGTLFSPTSSDVMIVLPFFRIVVSAGGQTYAASMSPRVQAATISGGFMLRICTFDGGMCQIFSSAISRWKCDVDADGTATFLPTRSAGLLMPEPSLATSCSDLPMLSRIQKSSTSTPLLVAAAMPVEPSTPIGMSPDANAALMSPADVNWRHLILYPVAFSKLPS